jgi:hypothetical protein
MIFYKQKNVESVLNAMWSKNGIPAVQLETGEVPLPRGGKMLCINFLPERFKAWSIPDEMVRLSIIALVSKRISKRFYGLQWSVNAKKIAYEREQYVVVAKYWSDSDKLRWLERCWFPVFSLNRMSVNEMITGRDFRGFDPDAILQELIW